MYCRMFLLLLLLGLSLSACGGDGNSKTPLDLVSYQPPVQHFSTTERVILPAGSDYLIVPFSTSESAADQIGFEISVESGAQPEDTTVSKHFHSQPYEILEKNNYALLGEDEKAAIRDRLEAQIRLDGRFRQTRERIAKENLLKDAGARLQNFSLKKMAGCQYSSECESDALCVHGECTADVTVLSNTPIDDFDTVETFSAYVAYKGDYCAVLVDQGNRTRVTEDSATNMGETFDTIIFPRLQAMFGESMLQDGSKAWDRNGDGLVWFALTSQFPTNVAGYFDPGDFVDAQSSEYSNEADILFVQPPGRMIPIHSIYGTLAHEFQHLLNFAAKYYLPSTQGKSPVREELWLDEGLAHFTEEAVGYGVDTLGVVYSMLEDFGVHRLVETRSSAAYDTIGLRGMAYLFVRATVENLGGLEYDENLGITENSAVSFLRALHASSLAGSANYLAASGQEWYETLPDLLAAIALDGRLSEGENGFDELREDLDTGEYTGVCMRCERDRIGYGDTLYFEGAKERLLEMGKKEWSIPNSAGIYFRLNDPGETVYVSVSSEEKKFGFSVIQL